MDVLNLFINSESDMNILGDKGETILMMAVYSSNQEMVKRIIEKGMDVNAIGDSGISPLVMAIRQKNENMIRLLLDYGANPFQPLAVIENMDGDIKSILKEHYTLKKLITEIF